MTLFVRIQYFGCSGLNKHEILYLPDNTLRKYLKQCESWSFMIDVGSNMPSQGSLLRTIYGAHGEPERHPTGALCLARPFTLQLTEHFGGMRSPSVRWQLDVWCTMFPHCQRKLLCNPYRSHSCIVPRS